MERLTRRWIPAVLTALTLLLGGLPTGFARAAGTIDCGAATPTSGGAAVAGATPTIAEPVAFPDGGGPLTVFAAASLTDAFNEMKTDLEAAHPGLTLTFSFAGSQTLVTQLQQGASADVLATANTSQMQAAQKNGNVAGDPVIFATNALVIVVPTANPGGVATAEDLAKPGLKLVLAQESVPVGNYSRKAICAMGGQAFADKVAANIVSEEEDVREVLAKVQLGEADAGIVYHTDALAGGDKVAKVDVPAAANQIAKYPVAAVKGGNAALADAFIAYLLGPDGQKILAKYEFLAP